MNCDLILNEDSCRFCLGEATKGSAIICSSDTYFCVDRRLKKCGDILEFLDLKIPTQNILPNVPSKICLDCKKTVTDFYSLKKNFHDNEAVLMGKTYEKNCPSFQHPLKESLDHIIEEFLVEHPQNSLHVGKYTDKLVISSHPKNRISNKEELKISEFARTADAISCSKCYKYFDDQSQQQNHLKHCFEITSTSTVPDENSNDTLDVDRFEEEQELEENMETLDESEYIEEDDGGEGVFFEEEQYEPLVSQEEMSEGEGGDEITYEVKIEPNQLEDNKPFVCLICNKSFSSRSGRDTHLQMKHKAPENLRFENFENHEIERVLDSGELVRAWKCPSCSHVSSKKNHHQTHMTRHAIKEKEETIKQEFQESHLVITNTKTITNEDERLIIEKISERIESSPERIEKQATLAIPNEMELTLPDDTLKELTADTNQQVQVDLSYICLECSVMFPSDKSLKRHQEGHVLASISTPMNFFYCPDCSVLFANQKDSDTHLDLHKNDDFYQYQEVHVTRFEGCEIILKTSPPQERLHENEVRCAYCVKIGLREEVNLHMALFHASLICPVCNRDFGRSLGYFIDHMKIKHPDQFDDVQLSFLCPHCNREFPSKPLMIKHCKGCDAKAFPCNHCDKKFALERQLKKHKAMVEGVKDHKCSACSKRFASRTELSVHTRSHTKEKPYKCTFKGCNKTFRTNSHLSSHMDLHNPNKCFQCQKCSARFQTRGARRVHERSHDEASSDWTCGLCHKEFGQRSHYVRHVNAVHQLQCNSANLEELIAPLMKKSFAKTNELSDDSSQ